jgi:hypothetical protein
MENIFPSTWMAGFHYSTRVYRLNQKGIYKVEVAEDEAEEKSEEMGNLKGEGIRVCGFVHKNKRR